MAALALLVLACPLGTAAAGLQPSGSGIAEEVYRELDRVREDRRSDLTAYLGRIQALAAAVPADPAMRDYFRVKSRYHQLARRQRPPAEAVAAIEELKTRIRIHYLEKYHAFYDILFIDETGFVFSTIRRQADYHQDLFAGEQQRSALVARLLDQPAEAFVDFEYYQVSDEPSAFFVEPMLDEGKQLGWFVLQCAVNKINSIFAREEGLGQTGEVFLVNRQQQLLTESRFRPEPSILNLHLSAANIESKFAEGEGHKIVTDYRGYRALTSFEMVSILDSEWLLIAKIDEDEVITRHFLAHREELMPELEARIRVLQPEPGADPGPPPVPTVVDLDEFRKSVDGRPLVTYGISTCTGVVMDLPGKFAYLGHASTYDRMYGAGEMDLLDHMFQRISKFEIVPYERRGLRVVLAAPHTESLSAAVEELLRFGFFLSQIRFLHHPEAQSATLVHDPRTGDTLAEWSIAGAGTPGLLQATAASPSLGDLVKELIDYSD